MDPKVTLISPVCHETDVLGVTNRGFGFPGKKKKYIFTFISLSAYDFSINILF